MFEISLYCGLHGLQGLYNSSKKSGEKSGCRGTLVSLVAEVVKIETLNQNVFPVK